MKYSKDFDNKSRNKICGMLALSMTLQIITEVDHTCPSIFLSKKDLPISPHPILTWTIIKINILYIYDHKRYFCIKILGSLKS
jgi:hypothetical protein